MTNCVGMADKTCRPKRDFLSFTSILVLETLSMCRREEPPKHFGLVTRLQQLSRNWQQFVQKFAAGVLYAFLPDGFDYQFGNMSSGREAGDVYRKSADVFWLQNTQSRVSEILCGEIRLWKNLDKLSDNHRGPHSVKFVPGMHVI